MKQLNWSDYKADILSLSKDGKSSSEILKQLVKKFGKIFPSSAGRKIRKIVSKNNRNKNTSAKILIFDIETAPMEVYCWSKYPEEIPDNMIKRDWFVLCWSAKYLFEDKIINAKLTKEELIEGDDKRIMEALWEVLDNSDIVIGHNCVEINTPVLKQDLTWCKAGDLKIGDKLVGFEEGNSPNETTRDSNGKWNGKGQRKVIPCDVIDFEIQEKECLKVCFENGDEIITTLDHYWLGMAENDINQRWYKTSDLRIGQRVNKYVDVWEEDNSYEAGWVSGFLSGEGSINTDNNGLQFCQRPTSTWFQMLDFCKKLGYDVTEGRKPITGGLGKKDTLYANIRGGKWESIKIIGSLNIKRFKEKIDWNNFGALKRTNINRQKIINIVSVGKKKVAVFGTTSKTFIGAGYPMHNCTKFDIKKSNTRFVKHGLPSPSPYQVIDTLIHARKQFAISSNRLDYLAGKFFEVGEKLETEKNLWVKCMQGDFEALEKMSEYCDNDVAILESVYLEMRGWISPHPNVALQAISNSDCCPVCSSTEKEDCNTPYRTYINEYSAYRCLNCHHVYRSRITNTPVKTNKDLKVSIPK